MIYFKEHTALVPSFSFTQNLKYKVFFDSGDMKEGALRNHPMHLLEVLFFFMP
jgi:hypothetical protein